MDTALLSLAELWRLVVLALVQGTTEFLPISSSAHLILVSKLTGWQDQGLGLDVAMHSGTLAAVMLYFRRDVGDLALGVPTCCGAAARSARGCPGSLCSPRSRSSWRASPSRTGSPARGAAPR